ncbi:MAG: hypothetical protein KAV83_06170 [Desulfobacterales bacterium]|nr:hypothetical protein [Desulfobacterales bacterium]
MTIRYFEKIKKRIGKLEWLIKRVSIDTEYDEDTDVGIIGGRRNNRGRWCLVTLFEK